MLAIQAATNLVHLLEVENNCRKKVSAADNEDDEEEDDGDDDYNDDNEHQIDASTSNKSLDTPIGPARPVSA